MTFKCRGYANHYMNSSNVSLLRRRQTYKYYISSLEYSLKLYSFGKQGIILIKCLLDLSLDAEWALKVNDLIFENNVYNLRIFENNVYNLRTFENTE